MTAKPARPRVEWREVDGILLLDKPIGLSSNQALQRVRRLYRAAKAGHTGSLDPLATGVLPLCFGQATKVAGLLLDSDKSYRAVLALGSRTRTGDREGEIIESRAVPVLERGGVEAAMRAFLGVIEQVPPMYSALKQGGRPLYALAREGIEVERAPRRVEIRAFTLEALEPGQLTFTVECSKGTYVRTLGEDLAVALGTVGHLAALDRTGIGAFQGARTHTFEALEALAPDEAALDALLAPVDSALAGYPAVALGLEEAARFVSGLAVGARALDAVQPQVGATVRVYEPGPRFLGIGTVEAGAGVRVRPNRLMAAGGP
jgi:tRNA pseudouridine55 synthase